MDERETLPFPFFFFFFLPLLAKRRRWLKQRSRAGPARRSAAGGVSFFPFFFLPFSSAARHCHRVVARTGEPSSRSGSETPAFFLFSFAFPGRPAALAFSGKKPCGTAARTASSFPPFFFPFLPPAVGSIPTADRDFEDAGPSFFFFLFLRRAFFSKLRGARTR